MSSRPRILIAPLDWGLGHATRCVPLVHALHSYGAEVVLAAAGSAREFLAMRFPHVEMLDIPAYGIRLNGPSVQWDIIRQVPRFTRTVRQENDWLNALMRRRDFEGIISDNRYGLFAHPKAVLITHQLEPMVPRWAAGRLRHMLASMYHRFSAIWVPDLPGMAGLAGRLAAPADIPSHAQFVGWISRFAGMETDVHAEIQRDWLVMVSGPHGQRRRTQLAVERHFKGTDQRVVLLEGNPGGTAKTTEGNIQRLPHTDDQTMVDLVQSSRHVLVTAGYSTLMDLLAMQRTAVILPTPGQSEQEYLATFLHQKQWFTAIRRHQLPSKTLVPRDAALPPFIQDFAWLRSWFESLTG